MRPVAVVAALALAAPSFAQDPKPAPAPTAAAPAAARAVVQKSIDAAGGAELLGKLKAGTAQIKGQMTLFGDDIDFTGSMAYEVPARYKLTLSADLKGAKVVIDQAVSGDKLVSKVNGADQPLDDKMKAELKTALRLLEAQQLVPLLDPAKFTLAAEKDADVNGKPAAVVLVTGKGFKDARLFFAKDTGLLVRTERKGLAPATGGDTQEVTETTTFDDYRKVSGLLLAFKSTVLHDGKKFMTFAYTEAKLLETVDPKLLD